MPSSYNFGEIPANSTVKDQSFYEILGVSPQCSQTEIRNAYRHKSKEYHPDTTVIDKKEASSRFQALKQAYDTLRFPEQRKQYDALLAKKQATHQMRSPARQTSPVVRSSASLDPEDRALSAGEIFALFILGITFLFCLLVALFLGIARGEMIIQARPSDSSILHQIEMVTPKARDTQKPPNIDPAKAKSHAQHDHPGSHHNPKRMVTQEPRKAQIPLFPSGSPR